MKITVVHEIEASGGTERLLIHLIRNWPDKNTSWEVLCHVRNSGLILLKDELKGYARVRTFSAGYMGDRVFRFLKAQWIFLPAVVKGLKMLLFSFICLVQFLYFRSLFSKDRPDFVYLPQGGYPGAFSEHMAGIAAKSVNSKGKVVASIQCTPVMTDRKLFSMIMDKVTNSYVDYLIFSSKHTMNEYVIKTKLCRSIMNVITCGICANTNGKKIKNNTGVINIGIIGSYERRKGHRVFFDAVDILKKNGILGFAVHCYGQSRFGEFADIIEYAKKRNIYELISWHEYEADFDKLYGPLDIVVQTSVDWESMPLVPMDAAAYYKPVIASRLEGLTEIVEDGVTGYLFDVGDSKVLAVYLRELIQDPVKRKCMGEAARKRFEQYFTATRMAQEYYNAFLKC